MTEKQNSCGDDTPTRPSPPRRRRLHLQPHLDPAVQAAFTAARAGLVREVRPLTGMPGEDVPPL